jgi:hypothetical protein
VSSESGAEVGESAEFVAEGGAASCVGVTEDNDFVIAGRPEDVAVEVAEELPGELLVP